jgi:phage gp36-like protein
MPYATATAYLARFGADEAAGMLADEEQLLTKQLLLDAIAVADGGSWTGNPSDAQKAAAQAALARLVRQLAVQSNFIDGYLRAAVTLPLAPGDANAGVLEDCCLALTRCGLADDPDNATEQMTDCCKHWRKWLVDVQARRVTLIDPVGQPVARTPGVRSGQAASGFDWSRFGAVQ